MSVKNYQRYLPQCFSSCIPEWTLSVIDSNFKISYIVADVALSVWGGFYVIRKWGKVHLSRGGGFIKG
jgi:hypothetical protein